MYIKVNQTGGMSMAKILQSIGFPEEMQTKIQAYASEHAQSFSAATVELAGRALKFQEEFGHLNLDLIKKDLDQLKKLNSALGLMHGERTRVVSSILGGNDGMSYYHKYLDDPVSGLLDLTWNQRIADKLEQLAREQGQKARKK